MTACALQNSKYHYHFPHEQKNNKFPKKELNVFELFL